MNETARYTAHTFSCINSCFLQFCLVSICQRSLIFKHKQRSVQKAREGLPCTLLSYRIPFQNAPEINVRRVIQGDSRKEVFQPHLPVRLPCYDLAPITSFTLGRPLRSQTSGAPGFHGLTGGVYKARERIHRARPGNVFTAPWLMRDY